MKTKKMTDAQREAKRERDRRYRAKKRAESAAKKPVKKTTKKPSANKPVVAKNLRLKVALAKSVATKRDPLKHKITHTPLEERVRVSLIALSSLCRFIAAGI